MYGETGPDDLIISAFNYVKSAPMRILIVLTILFVTLSSSAISPNVDHNLFDQLLKKHVNERGLVDYKGFKREQGELRNYLNLLSGHPPTDQWARTDQMAYWINAYNAFTIELILNHYPVRSIKDIGSKIRIPFVTTPWAAKFFKIGGEPTSLDNIEHGILRKKFSDPRIHFALVCAAVSCPPLRNEAYVGSRLDAQLNDQGRIFFNDPSKNIVTAGRASLSKILDWYGGDFKTNGQTIARWVNRYATTKLDDNAPVSYQNYNWALNEQ